MVCDWPSWLSRTYRDVLILVLMEYGLRQYMPLFNELEVNVLILVLMEYGLRLLENLFKPLFIVLILVLMEYGLRP